MALKGGAQRFTLQPGATKHAATIKNGDLTDALSALATLQVKHWVQDGHRNSGGFHLGDDEWELRVTLTLHRDGSETTRSLLFGKEILWPAPGGAVPEKEIYARTGGGKTLAGPMIFTLKQLVRDGLKGYVVKK